MLGGGAGGLNGAVDGRYDVLGEVDGLREVEGWSEELGAAESGDKVGEDDKGVGVGCASEKGTGELVGGTRLVTS
jgi:hypothetical protein